MTCQLKAVAFYGGKSGKIFVYKSIYLEDNSTAILKCTEPLYTIKSGIPWSVGMAFVPDQGEIYLSGGIADVPVHWDVNLVITQTIGKFTQVLNIYKSQNS